MVEKVFSTNVNGSSKNASDRHTLIVEIAPSHAVYIFQNQNGVVNDLEIFGWGNAKEDFEEHLNQVGDHSSLLKYPFKKVQLVINNNECMLAPSQGLTTEKARNFLEVVMGSKSNQEIFINEVSEEMSVIYQFPSRWIKELGRHVPVDSIKHVYTSIVSKTLSGKINDDVILKVLFYKHQAIIILLNQKKVQIVKTIVSESFDEVVYYLFSILQQNDLEAASTNLYLSGMVDVRSKNCAMLHQQFKKVITEDSSGKNFNLSFGDKPKHYLTPFINLAL